METGADSLFYCVIISFDTPRERYIAKMQYSFAFLITYLILRAFKCSTIKVCDEIDFNSYIAFYLRQELRAKMEAEQPPYPRNTPELRLQSNRPRVKRTRSGVYRRVQSSLWKSSSLTIYPWQAENSPENICPETGIVLSSSFLPRNFVTSALIFPGWRFSASRKRLI